MLRALGISLLALGIAACSAGGEGGAADLSQHALLVQLGSPNPPIVLDVRTPDEFASGHVPGARNVPVDEVVARAGELALPPDREVVVYCERGPRAHKAQAALEAAGLHSVLHLEGDMSGWRAANLPCEGCAPQ